MSDYQPFTVILGGVTKSRSLFRIRGNRAEITLMIVTMLVVLAWAVNSQEILNYIIGCLIVAIVVGLCQPWTTKGSLASQMMLRAVWQVRRVCGFTAFTPGTPARFLGKKESTALSGVREVPDFIDGVTPINVKVHDAGEVAVLLHNPPGELPYATVAFEVEPNMAGVQTVQQLEDSYRAWADFQSQLADEGSLVDMIQQVHRVQPTSLTRHVAWLERLLARTEGIHHLVLESYQNVLGLVQRDAEQHRSFVILRMPFTAFWDSQVRELHGVQNQETQALLAVQEAGRVQDLATEFGGFRRFEPLDSRSLAAAIRACHTHGFGFDDETASDGSELTVRNCWPAWSAHQRHVEVECDEGRRTFMRTARIPLSGFPGSRVHVSILRTLIANVNPAVVRTISVSQEFIAARHARPAAKRNVTTDVSLQIEQGNKPTDGSTENQLNSSQQTLFDLREASGHHGSNFVVHVCVSADDQTQLTRVCRSISSVAANLGFTLQWMDWQQDRAMASVLPLGGAIEPTEKSKLGTIRLGRVA